jgi:hypothetical protein
MNPTSRPHGPYSSPHTWTDVAGKIWKIEDLSDEHLLNILRLILRSPVESVRAILRKRVRWLRMRARCDGDSDEPWSSVFAIQAEALAELAMYGTDEEVLTHFVPQLPALLWEKTRRML